MNWITTLYCQFVRARGGKHRYVDGLCARCGRAKRKVKTKQPAEAA